MGRMERQAASPTRENAGPARQPGVTSPSPSRQDAGAELTQIQQTLGNRAAQQRVSEQAGAGPPPEAGPHPGGSQLERSPAAAPTPLAGPASAVTIDPIGAPGSAAPVPRAAPPRDGRADLGRGPESRGPELSG